MKKLFLLALILIPSTALATPSISSVSGTVLYGGLLDIVGAGYGTKPNQQKTECYANFEDASVGVACSSWSAVTSMGDINNVARVTTNCEDGSGCVGLGAINIESNNNNTANVSITDVGVGGKIYWGWDWLWPTANSAAYPASNVNWKTFRAWPSSVGQQNDIYGGQQIDSGFIYDTESSDFNTTTNVDKVFATAVRPPIGSTYQQIVMYHQLNSDASTSQSDGNWKTTTDGSTTMNITTWRSNTAAQSANGRYRTFYPIHMVMTGTTFPVGGNFRYDNIILETSYCVVWVSTVSTNLVTAKRNYMVVQTWVDGEITAVFAQNGYAAGKQLYVYVQENGGTINSSGFPITVASTSGGGGPPPLQPTEANQFCPCLP